MFSKQQKFVCLNYRDKWVGGKEDNCSSKKIRKDNASSDIWYKLKFLKETNSGIIH